MWREPLRRRRQDLFRDFMDRAEDLLEVQEHLEGLLGAVVSLTEDLSLDVVLDRVVRSACELVDAQYGALAIAGEDGQSHHLVTIRLDEEARRAEEVPSGQDPEGLLHQDPTPLHNPEPGLSLDQDSDLGVGLHLDQIRYQSPTSPAFPELSEDPLALSSFLDVPLRVRDTVSGNLFLADKRGGGDFTDEDEDLAIALAAAAGLAIQNAGLFEDKTRRQQWLEAGMSINEHLTTPPLLQHAGGLELIAGQARNVSGAALVVVASPGPEGTLRCTTSIGAPAIPTGQHLPGPVMATVLQTGQGIRVRDPRDIFTTPTATETTTGTDAGTTGILEVGMLGPVMVVVLGYPATPNGILIMARPKDADPFSAADLESAAVFGTQAGLALDLSRANRRQEEHALSADRDRIARDLHDRVIQRLFATGLSLQTLRRYTDAPQALERITTMTTDLDETIRELRDTIYSLQSDRLDGVFLTDLIAQTLRERTAGTSIFPDLRFEGPVNRVVPADVAEHLLAVLAEGISNAARHSGADHLSISVSAQDGTVEALIADDGRGFAHPERTSGLHNLHHRAAILGGTCTIDSTPGHGTRIHWSAPTKPHPPTPPPATPPDTAT